MEIWFGIARMPEQGVGVRGGWQQSSSLYRHLIEHVSWCYIAYVRGRVIAECMAGGEEGRGHGYREHSTMHRTKGTPMEDIQVLYSLS